MASNLNEIKEKYKQQFKIKELGSVEWLLGMKIERKKVYNHKKNKQLQILTISQEQYFEKVLKKFKITFLRRALWLRF